MSLWEKIIPSVGLSCLQVPACVYIAIISWDPYAYMSTDLCIFEHVCTYVHGLWVINNLVFVTFPPNRSWVQVYMRSWMRNAMFLHNALFGNRCGQCFCFFMVLVFGFAVSRIQCVYGRCVCLHIWEQPNTREMREHAETQWNCVLNSHIDLISDRSNVRS